MHHIKIISLFCVLSTVHDIIIKWILVKIMPVPLTTHTYISPFKKKWKQNRSLHFVILTISVKPFIIGQISDANNTSFTRFYIYLLKMSSISFDLSVWPKFFSIFHFFKQLDSPQLLLLSIRKIHWALDFIHFCLLCLLTIVFIGAVYCIKTWQAIFTIFLI